MPPLYGLHSQAKNMWVNEICNNCGQIMAATTIMERRRILQRLAMGIYGIGEITIDMTLAYIEEYLAELQRNS